MFNIRDANLRTVELLKERARLLGQLAALRGDG
jgi:hypothetical protein